MAAHSPGPWTVHTRKDGGKCILDAGGRVIALMKDIHDDDERAANAEIIAAAPLLLAELRKAEVYVQLQSSDPRNAKLARQDLASIRAAIANATGADQ